MVMSFSRQLTHVLSPSDAPLLLLVICHQKLNSEFAPVQSPPHPHPPSLRSSAVTNKVFLSQKPGTKKFFNYVWPQKWNSFFPPFLWLNLCMSLWFRCSRTAVQRQSSTKRWNEKAVWGDIEAQANSAPDWSAEHKCFPSFFNCSCVFRCWRKWRHGDGQSEPRYKRSYGWWGLQWWRWGGSAH